MSEIKVNSIKGVGATNAAITVNNSDGTCTANITNNLSNRNLIINGAMLVSQRGVNFGTLASAAYTLDRWNVDAGATVQQASLAVDEISDDKKFTKAIQMQGASSDYFRTKLEDVSNFSNQTLILSFYVKGASNTTLDNIYARQNFGTGGSSLVDTAFSNLSYSVTTSYTRYTSTVTLPSISGKTVGASSYLEIFMELPDSVTVYITGVQLEVGSVATDFEHRSFAQELALCQRYYVVIANQTDSTQTSLCNLGQYSPSTAHGVLSFPVEMRVGPSLDATSGSAYYVGYGSNAGEHISSFSLQKSTERTAELSCSLARTQGDSVFVRTNTQGAKVAFQAEL